MSLSQCFLAHRQNYSLNGTPRLRPSARPDWADSAALRDCRRHLVHLPTRTGSRGWYSACAQGAEPLSTGSEGASEPRTSPSVTLPDVSHGTPLRLLRLRPRGAGSLQPLVGCGTHWRAGQDGLPRGGQRPGRSSLAADRRRRLRSPMGAARGERSVTSNSRVDATGAGALSENVHVCPAVSTASTSPRRVVGSAAPRANATDRCAPPLTLACLAPAISSR